MPKARKDAGDVQPVEECSTWNNENQSQEEDEETILVDPSEGNQGWDELPELVEPLCGGPEGPDVPTDEHTTIPRPKMK